MKSKKVEVSVILLQMRFERDVNNLYTTRRKNCAAETKSARCFIIELRCRSKSSRKNTRNMGRIDLLRGVETWHSVK